MTKTTKTESPAKPIGAKPKALTKKELVDQIATVADTGPQVVLTVLSALAEVIGKQLGRGGPGLVLLPGVAKFTRKVKPATAATTRMNPFSKEMMNVPAKPESLAVRASVLKSLKDTVAG